MALKVTQEQLERWKKQAQGMKDKIVKYREKADLVVEKAVTTVEIGAASFGMGVAYGKLADARGVAPSVLGVPIDLGAGLGLNLMAYLGVGGKHVDHLHNLGNGSLAFYLGRVGSEVGKNWKAGQPLLGAKTAGELGDGATGRGMSASELSDLINA